MHIAIEGMDGVGKTSTARLLAESLGYKFVEKPLHYLFDNEECFSNYLRITNHINSQDSSDVKAMFYGLGNLFLGQYFADKNIVTDRHLASNYFWNSSKDNEKLFDFIVSKTGSPDITVLIYASPETRLKRIYGRNPEDTDINEVNLYPEAYNKMKCFLEKHKMEYFIVDNSDLTLDETVVKIIEVANLK